LIQLNESRKPKEVVIFTGKNSKKDNALDILRKIWERKQKMV
jgi:hypothetical protein